MENLPYFFRFTPLKAIHPLHYLFEVVRGPSVVHRTGEEFSASVYALPRNAAPQLPTLYWRPANFTHRHVDADDCAVVAGLQNDRVGGAVGCLRICQPGA